eukprot:scaffold5391_cov202-Prasinococcus_capsulatus_cf.AAC.1
MRWCSLHRGHSCESPSYMDEYACLPDELRGAAWTEGHTLQVPVVARVDHHTRGVRPCDVDVKVLVLPVRAPHPVQLHVRLHRRLA